jgi:hypothetical protein
VEQVGQATLGTSSHATESVIRSPLNKSKAHRGQSPCTANNSPPTLVQAIWTPPPNSHPLIVPARSGRSYVRNKDDFQAQHDYLSADDFQAQWLHERTRVFLITRRDDNRPSAGRVTPVISWPLPPFNALTPLLLNVFVSSRFCLRPPLPRRAPIITRVNAWHDAKKANSSMWCDLMFSVCCRI